MSVKVDPVRQPRMTYLFTGRGLGEAAGSSDDGAEPCAAAAELTTTIAITNERIRQTSVLVRITSPTLL